MIFGWIVTMALFTTFFIVVMPKDELEAITTYSVDPTTLDITLGSGVAGRGDASIWRDTLALLPHKYLSQHVKWFHVFSDGAADTLAYVTKTSYDTKSWILAVDRTDYRFSNGLFFTSTIIHEFAHILALEDSQIGSYNWRCDNFSTIDGCFESDSYVNQWYQKFWTGELAEQHRIMVTESTKKTKRRELVAEFFKENSSSFVSEYASTNAVEDFAESFVHYVLSEEVTGEGTVNTQKISFFNRFPELVDIRDRIRSTLNK